MKQIEDKQTTGNLQTNNTYLTDHPDIHAPRHIHVSNQLRVILKFKNGTTRNIILFLT